jgi:hypothetical protein
VVQSGWNPVAGTGDGDRRVDHAAMDDVITPSRPPVGSGIRNADYLGKMGYDVGPAETARARTSVQLGVILLRHSVADTGIGSDRIEDVVEACAAGRFAVCAIDTADQGMALPTGSRAGERGATVAVRRSASIGGSRSACAQARRSFAGQQQQEVED